MLTRIDRFAFLLLDYKYMPAISATRPKQALVSAHSKNRGITNEEHWKLVGMLSALQAGAPEGYLLSQGGDEPGASALS